MNLNNPRKLIEKIENSYSKTSLVKDNGSMSPTARKARFLLEKENNNSKKSRLESLLVQQYIGKFGSKSKGSKLNRAIETYVHDFIAESRYEELNNDTLQRLELCVKDIAERIKHEINVVKCEERIKVQEQKAKEIQQSIAKQEPKSRPDTGNELDMNQWAVVNAILQQRDNEVAEQRAEKERERRSRFKNDLENQVRGLEQRKEVLNEVKRKDYFEVNKSVDQFKKEQVAVKAEKEKVILQEKVIRQEQIEEKKRAKEREREERLEQERRDMARAKYLQDEEARRILSRKEMEKLQMEIVKRENEVNKQLKEEAKRQQAEYEKRLAKEYEERLLREEEERNNAFANRVKKLQNISKRFESTTGATLQQERTRDEERIKREIEEKQAADDERERKKQEQRLMELKKSAEYNLSVTEQKRSRKQLEREAEGALREKFMNEYSTLKEEERRVLEEKRRKMKAMREGLDEQVQIHKNAVRKQTALSEEEMLMNKAMIEKVKSDPKQFTKILQILKPPGKTNTLTSPVW